MNTPIKKVGKQTKSKTLEIFTKWLKEFELLYNLSPELTQNQIDKLEMNFLEIVKKQLPSNKN